MARSEFLWQNWLAESQDAKQSNTNNNEKSNDCQNKFIQADVHFVQTHIKNQLFILSHFSFSNFLSISVFNIRKIDDCHVCVHLRSFYGTQTVQEAVVKYQDYHKFTLRLRTFFE
jgi:hypothetical protein